MPRSGTRDRGIPGDRSLSATPKEACILNVPCVTLRENPERPETIEAGANMLAGTDATRIIEAAGRMLSKPKDWQNPYGDGKAGERIVGICS
jgi:UDP-N-acetylglucosamine 2-epimerase (non-hydrolysing)